MTNTDRAIGLKLEVLKADLPAALTAATGETWALAADQGRYSFDNDYPASDPAGLRSFRVSRADGFGLSVSRGGWKAEGRGVARVLVPAEPHPPEMLSRAELPTLTDWEATFDLDRPVKAIAGQLVRALVTPEAVAKWWALCVRFQSAADAIKDAARWRDLVGAAHGAGFEFSTNGLNRFHSAGRYSDWGRVTLSSVGGYYPGGTLEVDLPKDPEAAAAVVAACRLAVESVTAARAAKEGGAA